MKNKIYTLAVAVLFLAVGCTSTKKVVQKPTVVDRYIGTWELMIKDTPQGDIPTKMIITKNNNVYIGKLSNVLGEIPLDKLKIGDQKLSADFTTQGYDFSLSGTFKEGVFSGSVFGMGAQFLANGSKAAKK